MLLPVKKTWHLQINSPEKTQYKCPCCYNTPECHLNTRKASNNSALHNS